MYGIRNAPTDAQLATVDVLAFDLQDVGARFYTFVWTMTYCMEAAARNNKPFYVIDRPNPIGGLHVAGAPNTSDYGVIGRLAPGAPFGVATRHGMTAGEIAWMWNDQWMAPKVALEIITAPGWRRCDWWSDTGRVFVPPSPAMVTPATATVYPGTCIFAGSNVSEGRGTDTPFELIGAPIISGSDYATSLSALSLPGVRFEPATFTPTTSKYVGQLCSGVRIIVTNRDVFEPIRTGLHMLQTVYLLYPAQVTFNSRASMLMAVPGLETRIKTESVGAIMSGWQANLNLFKALRSRYLLYPDGPSATSHWSLFD